MNPPSVIYRVYAHVIIPEKHRITLHYWCEFKLTNDSVLAFSH